MNSVTLEAALSRGSVLPRWRAAGTVPPAAPAPAPRGSGNGDILEPSPCYELVRATGGGIPATAGGIRGCSLGTLPASAPPQRRGSAGVPGGMAVPVATSQQPRCLSSEPEGVQRLGLSP